MNKNKIYVLVGLPGIGKSTWLNEFLNENPNFTVASSDNYIEEKCKQDGITYDEGFSKYIKEADKNYKKDLITLLENGQDIIVDRTNLSDKSRAKILNRVPEGYTKTIVMFDISEEEHNKRLNERSGKTLPDKVLQSMKDNYVEPSFNEKIDAIITVDIN